MFSNMKSMMSFAEAVERLDECEREALNKVLRYGADKCERSLLKEANVATFKIVANADLTDEMFNAILELKESINAARS